MVRLKGREIFPVIIINKLLLFTFFIFLITSIYSYLIKGESTSQPIIKDPNLKAEIVYEGIDFPTSMAFLGQGEILVLEKNTGIIKRIVNGNALSEPLLDLEVANENERGLLGIAIAKNDSGPTYVFVYLTEAEEEDGSDPVGNRLYRYELKDNKLVNAQLLLDLPVDPGPKHNGGVVTIGPDNNVYVVIGDVSGKESDNTETKAQNYEGGPEPDGRAGIIRVTQDGDVVGDGLLGDEDSLDMYYAYGIRNSFGIDFDPVTGNLWDTENGPWYGDEINLVEPGFNSGWSRVQGIWEVNGNEAGEIQPNPDNLVDFDGYGRYSEPEFVWNNTAGPSAITFLNSDKYGKEYENDVFVGDVNKRNLYHFDLTEDRTELLLNGPLEDKVANDDNELDSAITGTDFGRITDIEVAPDGYLYVLSHHSEGENEFEGTIYRIFSTNYN